MFFPAALAPAFPPVLFVLLCVALQTRWRSARRNAAGGPAGHVPAGAGLAGAIFRQAPGKRWRFAHLILGVCVRWR